MATAPNGQIISPIENFVFDNGQLLAFNDFLIKKTSLSGTARNDILVGDFNDNSLSGGSGNDQLYGGSGHDKLDGGNGIDLLYGGGGADQLSGGNQADTLYGECGDDLLIGNSGADLLYAGAGDDIVDGGIGDDYLHAGDGNDRIWIGDDGDIVQAGSGNDVIGVGSHIVVADDEAPEDDEPPEVEPPEDDEPPEVEPPEVEPPEDDEPPEDEPPEDEPPEDEPPEDEPPEDDDAEVRHNHLIDAGDGDDLISTGIGRDWIAGGKGNDTIDAGSERNLFAFNRGDGADIVNNSRSGTDTISLGKGIRYADLTLAKSGNDLMLGMGQNESITLKNWYVDSSRRGVGRLQVVIGAEGGDYVANSSDKTKNRQVEIYDFGKLVKRFDTVRAATPAINQWAVMNGLLEAHLSGSNTAAIGSDLSYQYAVNGSLSGIGLIAAENILSSANFNSATPQTLQSRAQLEQGIVKLG